MLPQGYELCEDPDLLPEYSEQAEAIARAGGIRILRGRELAGVVLHGDVPVAGLWTDIDSRSFTYDIAVAEAHRRRGIGTHLAKRGLALGREYERELGVDFTLNVVSPDSERIMTRLGCAVTGRHPTGLIMRPSNPEALHHMHPHEREDHEFQPASEAQNCLTEAEAERRRLNDIEAKKIEKALAAGKVVITGNHPYYCRATDAFAGNLTYLQDTAGSMEEAEAKLKALYESADPEDSFSILPEPKVPQPPPSPEEEGPTPF